MSEHTKARKKARSSSVQSQPPAPSKSEVKATDEADLSPAQERRRSRYTRPRRYISRVGVILGLFLGLAGGLYFAWVINPPQEFDTAPWQLRSDDRTQYLVAVMMSHTYRNDLSDTIQRLVALELPGDDPIQQVADVACSLARSGYVNSSSGLRAIRRMMAFYQQQGKSGCADTLIPAGDDSSPEIVQAATPTPALQPPASKTPTLPAPTRPSPTPPTIILLPTSVPTSSFTIVDLRTFCSSEFPGVIEVRVQDFEGTGLPGQPVRVRWTDGESTFYTGLKPERGPSYADFEMEAGLSYTVEMPGLSDPSTTPLVADSCFTEFGDQSTTSYRVVFRSN